MKPIRMFAHAALGLIFAGCCIHQEPKPPIADKPVPDTRPFRLSLSFDKSLPLLGVYEYETGQLAKSRSRGPEAALIPHDARYIVKAFSLSRSGDVIRTPDTTIIFTRHYAENLDTIINVNIPDGDYRLYSWVDFVEAGTDHDTYYNTSDFEEIILADRYNHSGSNPWRDAFVGSAETSVLSRADDGTSALVPVNEAVIAYERPMAMYRFISTDLRRFIEQSRSDTRGDAVEAEGDSREPSRAPALSDYRVKMMYTRFMPCSFNMFTNRPADSWTGVIYDSTIRAVSDDEAEVAFDHVFVNGSETAVTVAMEVYDPDDILLARIPAFDVPLKRSRLTIVRGDFLTTKAGGAIGISPDSEGEFNIEIK